MSLETKSNPKELKMKLSRKLAGMCAAACLGAASIGPVSAASADNSRPDLASAVIAGLEWCGQDQTCAAYLDGAVAACATDQACNQALQAFLGSNPAIASIIHQGIKVT